MPASVLLNIDAVIVDNSGGNPLQNPLARFLVEKLEQKGGEAILSIVTRINAVGGIIADNLFFGGALGAGEEAAIRAAIERGEREKAIRLLLEILWAYRMGQTDP